MVLIYTALLPGVNHAGRQPSCQEQLGNARQGNFIYIALFIHHCPAAIRYLIQISACLRLKICASFQYAMTDLKARPKEDGSLYADGDIYWACANIIMSFTLVSVD